MKELVAAEAVKLRTLLVPRAVIVVAVALSALIGYASVDVAPSSGERPPAIVDLPGTAAAPVCFLVLVVAVIATAGEFRHRTILTTLLVEPRRMRVLAAKGAVAAGYGALLSLLGGVAALVTGLVTMHADGLPVGALRGGLWHALPTETLIAGVLRTLATVVLVGSISAVLAAGLGMLTRSSAVALVTLLLWKLVLEGIVPVVIRKPGITDWLPGGASDALVRGGGLGMLPSTLLLAGYALAVAGLAGALFVARDPA
jgi:ABC-2 type transport system permease protein